VQRPRAKDSRFELGDHELGPGVEALQPDVLAKLLERHARGDWGDWVLDAAGKARANELALRTGQPVISRYKIAAGRSVLIVTTGDRSRTVVTILE